ncbi:phage scaffolding protein [Lactobacillus sp. ESL0731]|uniref:phage scaffolding protein n=1 Tax=unclassified Lactobacillus TaxID=2620435 RepID=UPI0023F8B9AF|nr:MULTISPECIES: phage scaffolding protein [unclassified Lactobacillus]WEV51668.1 phage scaffolding protein [Lactobacillus sp. ESL0700]WEV62797.1 phage scaffolding protein [Lactobacillus sp. ESL0731]
MKREQLKELGLSEDVIDKVMSMNGEDINAAKGNAAELSTENESLKQQIANRDKDLKKLRKESSDNEDLSKQLKDWQDKYKQDTEQLNQQLSQTKLANAINQALTADKVRNPKAIKGLLNMDDIKLNDKGELIGLDEQIAAIKKSDAYLFDEGSKQPYNPASGSPATNTKAFKDLSLVERVQLKRDNPELFERENEEFKKGIE